MDLPYGSALLARGGSRPVPWAGPSWRKVRPWCVTGCRQGTRTCALAASSWRSVTGSGDPGCCRAQRALPAPGRKNSPASWAKRG